eukprot:CAMPEP_0201593108 /NCGR_PEP_ID=MMETSP0190_2-20130828/190828_1 /ASSEMBLY_ACC=CAM_ASM_000263 /TAXON_ID=37353 /ORGANISM="Rosalina sp." /LENGTH=124 /DNA_ID=CAMNT_0048052195 /DNA_START=754 /DNA_END=1125 /DNA_ORIENTATION=-
MQNGTVGTAHHNQFYPRDDDDDNQGELYQREESHDVAVKSPTASRNNDNQMEDDNCDDNDDHLKAPTHRRKYTPSFSNMSVSKTGDANNEHILSPSANRPTIPLDDLAKTPKELQGFGSFPIDN